MGYGLLDQLVCVCGKEYWPNQRWQHEKCRNETWTIVANVSVANAFVANKRKPGKYKDPEARKRYMRELMRKRRSSGRD